MYNMVSTRAYNEVFDPKIKTFLINLDTCVHILYFCLVRMVRPCYTLIKCCVYTQKTNKNTYKLSDYPQRVQRSLKPKHRTVCVYRTL